MTLNVRRRRKRNESRKSKDVLEKKKRSENGGKQESAQFLELIKSLNGILKRRGERRPTDSTTVVLQANVRNFAILRQFETVGS